MPNQRIILSIFRRGAAAMTNEIVADRSEAGVSFLDDYRTQGRFPKAHAASLDTTLLEGQHGYGVNTRFKSFLNHWKHPTYRVAAYMTLGMQAATRSHFYEQGRIDCGGVDYNFKNSGYFNRWAKLVPPETKTPLDLLSLGGAACRQVIGLDSTYASSKSVTPLLDTVPVAQAAAFLAAAPALDNVQATTGRGTTQAMLDTNIGLTNLPVKTVKLPSDASGAPKYPNDGWALRLRDAALMIAAGTPSRYISVDYDGWDHHSDMGGTVNSPSGERNHAIMLAVMDAALLAFIYDMTQLGFINRIMICSQTEFHRTMRENGNQGADHGMSSHAYAWGPTVNSDLYGAPLDLRAGSSAYTDPANSFQNPTPNRLLAYTTDYRCFQRLQLEWLSGRVLTSDEVTKIWGATFAASAPPSAAFAASIGR